MYPESCAFLTYSIQQATWPSSCRDNPDAPFLKGAPHLPRGTIWTRIRIRLRSLRKNDDTIKLTENKMRIRLWSLRKNEDTIKLTEKKNEDKVMLTETK